ncbi:MAG: glycosyltransferase [Mycetocola sp.]
MHTTAARITVGVLTYRRPDDLAALLPTLVEQARGSSASVEVVVVDNDPEAGAAGLVTGYAPGIVRYVHEPTPGIAAARNRTLDEAASSDLLVFIDDDERPVPGWLDLMVGTWEVDRPAAVVGPVISEFSEEPGEWIRDGGFFTRRRLMTGTAVTVAATNNLLLDLAVVRRLGLRFDEGFGLSGGSDTLFTRALAASGERMVWCDEAIVFDVVPVGRLTRDWVLQRYYRSGNSWSRTSVVLTRSRPHRLATRMKLTAAGAVRVLGGTLTWLWGAAARSTAKHAGGLRTLNRGMGMVSGAWGHVYSEYRRA